MYKNELCSKVEFRIISLYQIKITNFQLDLQNLFVTLETIPDIDDIIYGLTQLICELSEFFFLNGEFWTKQLCEVVIEEMTKRREINKINLT